MSKRSKRYRKALEGEDKTKKYSIEEAIALAKKEPAKFDQGMEIHLRLGIDPKKGDQIVRSSVILPHGTGKTKKIMAFVSPAKEEEAKKAGADFIGGDEDIKKIKQTQKITFDVAVATPDMMRKIAPIAKTLGQKGLMPNPKTGTIGPNIGVIISELKKGKVTFKNDDSGNLHQLVGRASFEDRLLAENIRVFIEAVRKAKPAKSKGVYLRSAYLCSTMGPAIRISI